MFLNDHSLRLVYTNTVNTSEHVLYCHPASMPWNHAATLTWPPFENEKLTYS